MSNLPAHRDAHNNVIAPQPAGAIQRALTALLQPPADAPMTDAFDDAMDMMAATREYVARIEAISARRRAKQAGNGKRRWLG